MEPDPDALIDALAWQPDSCGPDGRELIHIPLRVDAGHAGYRLDRYLARRFARLSRNRVTTMIQEGRVRRLDDGLRLTRGAHRVREGDRLVISRPAPNEPELRVDYRTLFEDPHMLVIDKPAGLPVHPSARYHHHTLTALMRTRLGAGHGWEMAHRLDRETSGVMVFGRVGSTGPEIKGAFFRREVEKTYLAIVHGRLEGSRVVDLPLGPARASKVLIKQGPRALDDEGLAATTRFEALAHGHFRDAPATLVRAEPKTGRTHQIRVHLAETGHAIVGDKLYGLDEQHFIDVFEGTKSAEQLGAELGLQRHALHAWRLALPHPVTGERLCFEAPWPPDLAQLIALPG